MFFDNVVFAGVLTVGLMVLFFAGFEFLSGRTRISARSDSSGLMSTQGILGDFGCPFFCLGGLWADQVVGGAV